MDKKIKLMVGCNLYNINPVCYSGHMSMWYQMGKRQNLDVMLCAPWRNPIDKARNMAVDLALMYECDYLFFYDDDMYFFDGLVPLKLLDRMVASKGTEKEIHIIQAKAFIRGYPYNPMVFVKKKLGDITRLAIYEDWEDNIDEDGLVKCDAVGCCATMIDLNVVKRLPKPYFLTGETHTEDVYFCMKCHSYLENVGVYMDSTISIGHTLDNPILCNENVVALKELHEKYDLGQTFLPDPGFALRQIGTIDPFKFVKLGNPLTIEEEKNG